MKKLAKLFLFVLVFALMASVLVACGEDKTTTDEPSTPTDTSETPTTPTDKEEPTVTPEEPPHIHAFNEWTMVSAPTCITGGIETRACSVCGTIERRSVDALGHNYGEWKTTKEPTCTGTGEKEIICSRCNDVQKQTLSALGHSFGDWVVTKEATCQKGSEERACSVCGYVEKKDIPADYTTHIFEGDFCTVCGEHKGTEGLQFELVTNDTVAVTGYTGSSTTVYIPSSYVGATVTRIKAEAFKDDTTITEIVIPDSVTSIWDSAFSGCSSLTSVTIGDSVTSIGDSAFYNCPIETATIPAIACSYVKNSNLKTVVITSGKSIGNSAFSWCSNLTSITIPDSVTSIRDHAFYGCYRLVEVYNKSSLNITKGSEENGYVGYYAKAIYTEEYTSKLSTDSNGYLIYPDGENKILIGYTGEETELTLPEGITKINQGAFYGNNKITSITIPDSVTSIGGSAFDNCSSLTSVTIGNSVTSIGSNAFSSCSRLTSITFQGTKAQWRAIRKGRDWNLYTIWYTVHCTDGDI